MAKKRVDKSRFYDSQVWCRAQGCLKRGVHDHHVVFEQHVRNAGGDISDPRNAWKVCWDCHGWQHKGQKDGKSWRIKTTWLRDENIEFAFEVLGLAAEYYFERYYDNSDPDPRIRGAVIRMESGYT